MKILVFVAWFAGLWLQAKSACEESAIISRKTDRLFLNESLGIVANSENELVGRNISCTNISQSLGFEILHPTRRRIAILHHDRHNYYSNNRNYRDGHGNIIQTYWKYGPNEEDIPCNDFTIVDSIISTLPPSFLSSYPDVVTLDLRSIHIKTITPKAFKELTKLQRLHLDGNEIRVINAVLFYSLENLQMLTLSRNSITTFDFETASLLKHLNYLDLSGNPIEQIPDYNNSDLSNLQTLLLNNTLIDGLNVSFTKDFKLLNLSSNYFSDVDFSLYAKAKTLDLSYNQIARTINIEYLLSELVYLNHNNLSDFDFSCINNNITLHLNISNNELGIITAGRSNILQTLDVSFNSISIIQNDSFAEMFVLLHLYLQNNLLTTVAVDSFRDLHALAHLDLSSNKIQQFQSGTFSSMTKLKYLNIQHNRLTSIFQLNSLVNLNELYADHNGIQFNQVDLKLYFKYLKVISFSHNPWSCENLARAYHELKENGVVVAKGDSLDVENLHGIACSDSGKTTSVDSGQSVDAVETPSGKARTSNDENFDQVFSKFVSYLHNNKFVIGNNNNVDASNSNIKSETSSHTSLIVKPEISGGGVGALAILNLLLLTAAVILLSCLVYISYKNFMKVTLRNNQENISMQERLIIEA